MKLVRLFCYSCSRLLRDGASSFDKVAKTTGKKQLCVRCGLTQPVWTCEASDNKMFMTFGKDVLTWGTDDLFPFLASLDEADLLSLGITPHPENMIITVLPVLPPCTRPSVIVEDKICDDDLTIQYTEIIKANQAVRKDPTEKNVRTLIFRITTLFNNSAGKSKYSTNGKAIKGIKERLASKHGLMRDNLMGKRVEESGRTVVGPEPTLRLDQIAVPPEMAKILSIPECVTRFNQHLLTKMLEEGKVNRIRRQTPDGEQIINVKYSKELPKLVLGDQVQRQLQDGDEIPLNRQPTLHSGSFMSLKAVIREGKTLRINLPITKSFNMDFDGDEGNIHIPQSYPTICELQELSTPKNHVLSLQNGQANIVLVQDNLLGVYLMTLETDLLDREQLFDLCMLVPDVDIFARFDTLQEKGIDSRSGRGVLALAFPATFTATFDETVIENGVILKGLLTKKGMNHIIKILYHIYDPETVCTVINRLTFLSNGWLWNRGFSVGLEDCLLSDEKGYQFISENILRCFVETTAITSTIWHDRIREVRIQEALNKARDIGMKIAKNEFRKDNNFIHTVSSGSKGDYFNITQISGLLGQQYLKGKRIDSILNNGDRSLVHYPFSIEQEKHKYEARGFVRHSFLHGLSPREMYFHAVAGRSGIVDTAMGTSETGYMQRRIIKLMEDVHIANDQTIRDDTGHIYQYFFGRGQDVTATPPNEIVHIANKLNAEYEMRC